MSASEQIEEQPVEMVEEWNPRLTDGEYIDWDNGQSIIAQDEGEWIQADDDLFVPPDEWR